MRGNWDVASCHSVSGPHNVVVIFIFFHTRNTASILSGSSSLLSLSLYSVCLFSLPFPTLLTPSLHPSPVFLPTPFFPFSLPLPVFFFSPAFFDFHLTHCACICCYCYLITHFSTCSPFHSLFLSLPFYSLTSSNSLSPSSLSCIFSLILHHPLISSPPLLNYLSLHLFRSPFLFPSP